MHFMGLIYVKKESHGKRRHFFHEIPSRFKFVLCMRSLIAQASFSFASMPNSSSFSVKNLLSE